MTLRKENEEVVEQEPERLRSRTVVLVVVVAILISVATVGWAWLLLPTPRVGPEAPRSEGVEVGKVFIYDIRQRAVGLEKQAADLERLDSYGWVERRAGLARIPIDEATEIYLERAEAGARGRDALDEGEEPQEVGP